MEVDAEGLRAALTELADITTHDSGVNCDFDCDLPVRVEDNETATHLYRIAQEAVTNALKHGAPRHVKISLAGDGTQITLSVRDDGKGISSTAWQAQGMGLKTIMTRRSMPSGRCTRALWATSTNTKPPARLSKPFGKSSTERSTSATGCRSVLRSG